MESTSPSCVSTTNRDWQQGQVISSGGTGLFAITVLYSPGGRQDLAIHSRPPLVASSLCSRAEQVYRSRNTGGPAPFRSARTGGLMRNWTWALP